VPAKIGFRLGHKVLKVVATLAMDISNFYCLIELSVSYLIWPMNFVIYARLKTAVIKKEEFGGSKGTLSNRDADQYAIRKAREYRHENNLRLLREQPLSYLL
jgi:hypothetical protein